MTPPGQMTYQRARNLVLLSGLIVLGIVVLTMVLRGVDPVEVAAALFYAPLFVGLLFFGLPAGIGLGLAAAAGYLALRWPAIQLVGFPALAGLILSRVAGFVVFGAAGGWAAEQLRRTVEKLELYDEIDDETGLGNARSVVTVIDTERSRADRYQKVFSVVVAAFAIRPWEELGGRAERARLRELGKRLGGSVRDSDHVAHARSRDSHLVAVVLPETGAEGASTFASNLATRIGEWSGLIVDTTTVTYPDEPERLSELADRFHQIHAAGRPRSGPDER